LVEWTGAAILIFLILIPRTEQIDLIWPQWLQSLYYSLSKVIFVMGVLLMILPTLLNCKGSIINRYLDTSVFNFISKVSFCTYLVHLTVMNIWLNSRSNSKYLTIIPTMVEFGGILVISLFFGLLMTYMI
jgi:peptidoglycan/LPS O-acetylase OafA/YrhL